MTKIILSAGLATALFTARASACDLCACDLPLIRIDNRPGWHIGAGEQYTDYGSLRLDGRGIPNDAGQYMHSSITQLFVGYDFTSTIGVQVNVPLIYRTFRRVEDGAVQSGRVSGLGDVSLLAHWVPLRVEKGDFLCTGRLIAGIKFPTGDSDRLAEEAEHSHGEEGHEEDAHGGEAAHDEHEHEHETEDEHTESETPSGVHGHDLALGSGSVDGIFGADVHVQWQRLFLDAGVLATVRSEGSHDYEYADDLAWYAAVGVIVWKSDELNVGLEARVNGETKGEDKFQGARLDDTASTNIYVGPRVVATWHDRLSVDVGVEFPVRRENTGVQTAPDLRFQAGLGWQF